MSRARDFSGRRTVRRRRASLKTGRQRVGRGSFVAAGFLGSILAGVALYFLPAIQVALRDTGQANTSLGGNPLTAAAFDPIAGTSGGDAMSLYPIYDRLINFDAKTLALGLDRQIGSPEGAPAGRPMLDLRERERARQQVPERQIADTVAGCGLVVPQKCGRGVPTEQEC